MKRTFEIPDILALQIDSGDRIVLGLMVFLPKADEVEVHLVSDMEQRAAIRLINRFFANKAGEVRGE